MTEDGRQLDDRWVLGWRGLVVTRVEADDGCAVLYFGDTARLTLAPDAGATVSTSLTGERVPASLHALAGLVDKGLLSAVAFTNGTLRLVLDNGYRVDARPSVDGVAWRATSPERSWASRVGGGLDTQLRT